MNKLYELSNDEKIELIRQNKYLDIFVKDTNWIIRKEVARHGYGLNILINDSNWAIVNSAILYCKKHKDKEECQKKYYNYIIYEELL